MRKTELFRFTFVAMSKCNVFFIAILLSLPTSMFGQSTSLRLKTITKNEFSDTTRGKFGMQLDTLCIYPFSFEISSNSKTLLLTQYAFSYSNNGLQILDSTIENVTVRYRVFPSNLNKVYQNERLLKADVKEKVTNPFLIIDEPQTEDPFATGGIQKSGSISRGVNFGNNQDLSINSNLNLQLNGNITENLKLTASLSDDNLPLQAQGNTNKLQEFDKVFVQLSTNRLKLTGGDYWLYRPKGYFVKYNKRAQGISLDFKDSSSKSLQYFTQTSLALSRGKFNRAVIQGVEGNQGPYRLRGAENEPFIVVLSGTEKIYIDGKELKRGQEFDYVIDYNTAELSFTTRNQITKDIRIIAEYQYSDQNYARILQQVSANVTFKNTSTWFNFYNELDAKNQPIQQSLSLPQRKNIANLGDSIQFAQISSFDSVGYQENQIVYKLASVAGIDSVLIYSVNKDSALYRANFSFVGANKGNYKFLKFGALGKIYEFVPPIGNVKQGDFEPSRSIITPKKRKMISIGNETKYKNIKILTELALSENDINTFSKKDKKNDQDGSVFLTIEREVRLKKDTNYYFTKSITSEVVGTNFTPIEIFRSVEFDRDWNTRNQSYRGSQISNQFKIALKNQTKGVITLAGNHFQIGKSFQGFRGSNDGRWNYKGFRSNWTGSYLQVKGNEKSKFLRHKIDVSQKIGQFRIGFKDDQEQNVRTIKSLISNTSYQFYDWQIFGQSEDTTKIFYSAYYRERYDKKADSVSLVNVAKAKTAGVAVKINSSKTSKIGIQGNLRSLTVINSKLLDQTPENTLGARLDYDGNLFRNALKINTFYEIGAGLELKREFIYIKVNDGQGTYFWNDYNKDNIKDLNEFEVALYTDQAGYIRVFTPSSEYVKVYTNELNQSVFWQPEKIWSDKKDIRKVLKYFSNQTRVRLLTKASDRLQGNFYNPFYGKIADTILVSSVQALKNTLFFNRTGSEFGFDLSYEENRNKTLFASGFDQRNLQQRSASIRYNFAKYFALVSQFDDGRKRSIADYVVGRNYDYKFQTTKSNFSYTPSTSLRITADYRYAQKLNNSKFGDEKAFISDVGASVKWNQASKGSLQASINLVKINFKSVTNNALAFEFLEALKPGQNYVWNLSYQRNLSKTLQLTLQYNGRKSIGIRTIHAGGMELRAFF